jgi:hypothetical protein
MIYTNYFACVLQYIIPRANYPVMLVGYIPRLKNTVFNLESVQNIAVQRLVFIFARWHMSVVLVQRVSLKCGV